MSQQPVPRSAYVHVPFCAHRCGYCNFTLVAGRNDLVADYLRAIEFELQALGGPHDVDTLFFGGGTPNELKPSDLGRLIELATRTFPLSTGYEFSVELNPLRWDGAMLADSGVNRISLGGQSFDAAKLRTLERDHDPAALVAAIELGKRHFPATSADLIFGVPGETLDVWRRDLATAIALQPEHVSTYGLTFEQGTSFWSRRQHGRMKSLDEELERDMYALAIDLLTAAGYEHYEVSNFAKPGHRCRHNEAYWAGDGYFAVGPGAASYVDGRRAMNHRSTTTWLKRVLAGESPTAETESLDAEDRAREMLVFGLRRIDGVERRAFEARSGFSIDELVGDALRRLVEQELLTDDGAHVRLTRGGLFVSDAIWPMFLRR